MILLPEKGQEWRCVDTESDLCGMTCVVVYAAADPDLNGMGDIELLYDNGVRHSGKVFRFITSHEYQGERSLWTTKEGVKMLPFEFGDSHLVNTIRFIECRAEDMKNAEELACIEAECFLQGDMATYYAGQEARSIGLMSPGEYLQCKRPIYNDLCKEAKRRGLTWESALPDGEVVEWDEEDEEDEEGDED